MRRIGRFLAAGLLAAAVCLAAGLGPWPGAVRAAEYDWIGAGTGGKTATDPADPSTQWNNPANWQQGTAPGSSDWANLPLSNAGYVWAQTCALSHVMVGGPSSLGAFRIGDGAAVTTSSGIFVGGYGQQGRVVQTGGSLTGHISVGTDGGTGTYLLEGGTLTVPGPSAEEWIGYGGTGVLTQTGGTHVVENILRVGYSGGSGTLNLGGGVLHTGSINVGTAVSSGALNITDASARIEVAQLVFGPQSTFSAVPGAEIHTIGTGPRFYNNSTNENALQGLASLSIVMDWPTSPWGSIEVAGKDLGASALGFIDNFALGGLVVGGSSAARLWLEDKVDNGNRPSAEALYVHDLYVGPGATLDLAGLHLYYDGAFSNNGSVIGGAPMYVPEPASLVVAVIGALAVATRRATRRL